MKPNEDRGEDRRGDAAPIVLELEPSESFVYRSTVMPWRLAASDERSDG